MLLGWMLLGCSTVSENPRPLTPVELAVLTLEPEPDQDALERAIHFSIAYYQRLPAERTFAYGEQSYNAAELIASHQYFLQLLKLPSSERDERLRRDFLWLESRNENERAFFTGYYEPLLRGSLTPTPEFPVPLYPVPGDLITVSLKEFGEEHGNEVLRGKLQSRRLVPYDNRKQIAYQNSLAGRAEPLAWVKNDIELFFLQIQGSGVIELSDGQLYRVNYAEQNGHPYRAIGKLLLGEIPREKMSLRSLKDYLYANPERVEEILNYNPSYTFFRHIPGDGPLGNIEVPLTAERSIAMDHRLVPRGGLVFYDTNLPTEVSAENSPLRRFALVQDTGGAIRGHGRADIFWGRGAEAERIAGPMKQPGRLYLLVTRKEVLSRIMQSTPVASR